MSANESMSDFIKCQCPHCGQNIEYLSEGTGETVPCPTCEKPVTLTPANQPQASDEIKPDKIPSQEVAIPHPTREKPVTLTPVNPKEQKTVTQREAYVAGVRDEPATEKQKEKLRYFGYAFDENISKGQASDALDKCVRDFPEKNLAYYNRPATEEQKAKLRSKGHRSLTYGKAKDLIRDKKIRERDEETLKYVTYSKSEDFEIDQAWAWMDAFREVKREQLAKAWAIVKSRMADKSQKPDMDEVEDTMEELFPDFRKTARDSITYKCKDCGGIFKARIPSVGARSLASRIPSINEADRIQVTIQCPSCGRDKTVGSLNVCKYTCPHCSKECLVAKSQTGQQVKCLGCSKDFFAAKSKPSMVRPRIRLMQYVEQPLEQTNDDAPTEKQLEEIKKMELKLDLKVGITASQLDELLKLGDKSPRAEDLKLFKKHGITYYEGDAFAIYAAADLVRCFEKMFAEGAEYADISMASAAASEDPAVKKATITLDQSGKLIFTWPKRKLEQWYRKGAKY